MNKIVRSSIKIFLLRIFLCLASISCFAQNQSQKSEFWKRVRFGGGVGLNFANGGFSGTVAPSAIYQFNTIFAAGVGANLNYYSFNRQKLWAYGPNAIVLANPISQIQLSVEIEQLRVNSSIQTTSGTQRNDFWSPALFIGAGYNTNFATVGIRYNVLYDSTKSIYLNAWIPFVRFYF